METVPVLCHEMGFIDSYGSIYTCCANAIAMGCIGTIDSVLWQLVYVPIIVHGIDAVHGTEIISRILCRSTEIPKNTCSWYEKKCRFVRYSLLIQAATPDRII